MSEWDTPPSSRDGESLDWAKAVIEMDAEGDNISTAAKIVLKALNSALSESAPVAGIDVQMVSVPLEHARLIRKVFLPRNPNRARTYAPETTAAVRAFISAVESRAER